MKAIGIIPARMEASRFPGKPMAPILGLPMVGHCYHRAELVMGLEAVYVATCNDEILDFIKSINGNAVMTSTSHNRATTRTAEALDIIERQLGEVFDIVVMIQGDEPLVTPEAMARVLPHFADPEVEIVNIMSRFRSLESFRDVNNVKVVADHYGNALYFLGSQYPLHGKAGINFLVICRLE